MRPLPLRLCLVAGLTAPLPASPSLPAQRRGLRTARASRCRRGGGAVAGAARAGVDASAGELAPPARPPPPSPRMRTRCRRPQRAGKRAPTRKAGAAEQLLGEAVAAAARRVAARPFWRFEAVLTCRHPPEPLRLARASVFVRSAILTRIGNPSSYSVVNLTETCPQPRLGQPDRPGVSLSRQELKSTSRAPA